MIELDKLLACGFSRAEYSNDDVHEHIKQVPVRTLQPKVKLLFTDTDVNDTDIATIWIDSSGELGISVHACNAHCGGYTVNDPLGKAILHEGGIEV